MSLSELLSQPERTLVVAEVGQAHDGSLDLAHAYIEAVADAGVDAVKFQTHIAAAESTPAEPWRVHFSHKDESRYQYWRRMEFERDEWLGLRNHARERGLYFISSAFSVEATDLLEAIGLDAWKVASGQLTDRPVLQRMLQSDLPILISSGMSTFSEIDEVTDQARETNSRFAVLQCTSAYPVEPERLGLNMLDVLRNRYNCPVGLSDHSGKPYAGIAAAALGADIVEVHVTLSRRMPGPDVVASLTVEEIAELVEAIRFINTARAHPVDKDQQAAEMVEVKRIFSKSLVAAQDLEAGTILRAEDLVPKKPGTGLPPHRLGDLLGRTLTRAVKRDELVRETDVH